MSTQMSSNRMYIIYAPIIVPMCLKTSSMNETKLWHGRYGHLSYKGLNTLVKNEMVRDLPALKEESEVCSDCMMGKQHRESIPKKAKWRATMKLELIHSDVCGPINPQSNGGNTYFITFTDDFSRKTWVYFLHDKASVFDIFKKFKVAVEGESGCRIQCLRTDRGGEFTSNEFSNFCSNQGIKRQLTTAYTPQQNGVSERKNRTLMNMVRCLLNGRNVPKMFWPEAVKWAAYVLNRSPTLSVKNITPEEAWSDVKPTVKHFRVFGCVAFVHVPSVNRKKLDNRSTRCVLLGVSEESKAYKLYDPVAKKIIVSRDVVFEESKGWNWDEKTQTGMIEMEDNNEEVGDVIEEHSSSESSNNNSGESTNNDSTDEEVSEGENHNEQSNRRARKKPEYLDDYITGEEIDEQIEQHNLAVFSTNNDPTTYEEAIKHEEWRKAMDQEIDSIEKNNTWNLTGLPSGAKKIGVKWVYKTKLNKKGEVEKYKARLASGQRIFSAVWNRLW